MSRTINLFMWGYQWHFRNAIENRARELLQLIAPELEPKALLVGIRRPGNEVSSPVCLEPEDGEWNPEMYFGCAKRTDEIYAKHPNHNIYYGDDARMNDKPENIRKQSVFEAIKEATNQFDTDHDVTTFYGWPTSVNGYDVLPMLQFENTHLRKYPSLPAKIEWSDFKSQDGFLQCVISKLLDEATEALKGQDPGRFFGTFDADKASILRHAGASFSSILTLVTQDICLQDIFESLNEISAKRYEGTEAIGEILFSSKKSEAIKSLVTLGMPVSLQNHRLARKVVELSGNNLCCICTGAEGISGLGVLDNQNSNDVFRVVFSGYYKWDFYYQQLLLMKSSFGVPTLPSFRLQEEIFKSTIRRIFERVLPTDEQRLWLIVEAAMDQKHGTLIVISNIAEQEAKRLNTQSIEIQPVELTQDLVRRVSGIDGAILTDQKGTCWAIGVILDGVATKEGDPSRGARYNSAIRYVKSSKAPVICLVVSEDGYVDMLPTLRPQIRLSELEKQINLLKTKNINNYLKTRIWIEQHRFYFTSGQCEEINKELIRIENAPRDPREIRIATSPFVPQAEMDATYYLPESSNA